MYRILDLPIPKTIDSHLWRQALRVLLDEGTEWTLNESEGNSIQEPNLELHADFWWSQTGPTKAQNLRQGGRRSGWMWSEGARAIHWPTVT